MDYTEALQGISDKLNDLVNLNVGIFVIATLILCFCIAYLIIGNLFRK